MGLNVWLRGGTSDCAEEIPGQDDYAGLASGQG